MGILQKIENFHHLNGKLKIKQVLPIRKYWPDLANSEVKNSLKEIVERSDTI